MVTKKPITIKDVAREAGVSISTVSRVINDSKPVTNEVKQRVLDIIKETGYVPNPLARSLVTKKSQLIGVIVPEVTDTFSAEILNGIEEISKMYDYDILLANTYSEKEAELKNINLLRAKQVEGIVMICWDIDQEVVNVLENSGIPAVFISKTSRDIDIYNVSTQNYPAAKEMTKYLIDKGHKKIALMLTGNENAELADERLEGYKSALKENKIKFDSSIVKTMSGTTYEAGYASTKELLSESKEIPHAIFASSDEVAIGVINACFDLGYKVPEDISVAGFNDVKLAKIYRPKLTTVYQPLFDIGAVAIRMIIKMVKGEEIEDKKVTLPFKIVERESVIDRKTK
ncbi:LacI family DNA-binding transcriptional regulator [Peptostreptococcus equinus]|uniref:LacI family DNA-binding transcriptional regulator n=1 Tax=Peptostreptococcus equinus TaxID=3003601 RepID=A0ABY7JPB6_9FIRM|nr:LacI family DNA-binding transcriptional regulator [Peptostreptococcus sp. CBA3647]WAW14326.1 LacI family DNA-binding transcriptional regulator [Peptostreptococcus sp. CBA3647]